MLAHDNLGLDALLRVRLEPDLKRRLKQVAKTRRKRVSEYLREELWQLVERMEREQHEHEHGGAQ
jgi:predicted transcriptional regulator